MLWPSDLPPRFPLFHPILMHNTTSRITHSRCRIMLPHLKLRKHMKWDTLIKCNFLQGSGGLVPCGRAAHGAGSLDPYGSWRALLSHPHLCSLRQLSGAGLCHFGSPGAADCRVVAVAHLIWCLRGPAGRGMGPGSPCWCTS